MQYPGTDQGTSKYQFSDHALSDGLSPHVIVRPLTSEMQKKELAWLFALYIAILFERRLKLYFFLGHKKNCVFSFVASYAFLMSINQRTYITCHYFRLNRRLGISLENSHLRVVPILTEVEGDIPDYSFLHVRRLFFYRYLVIKRGTPSE